MENEVKTETEWNDLRPTEKRDPVTSPDSKAGDEMMLHAPKNPSETPTAELVKDYEDLLASIKSGKLEYERKRLAINGTLQELDEAFAEQSKGAVVEAGKLLVLIRKRLGMPPIDAPVSKLQARGIEHPEGFKMLPAVRKVGNKASGPMKYCEQCGRNFHAKGFHWHQRAHARYGAVIPPRVQKQRVFAATYRAKHAKPVYTGRPARGPKEMSEIQRRHAAGQARWLQPWIKAMHEHQPIKATELAAKIGQNDKRGSVAMSTLKAAGYAKNDENGLWTLTAKGAAL